MPLRNILFTYIKMFMDKNYHSLNQRDQRAQNDSFKRTCGNASWKLYFDYLKIRIKSVRNMLFSHHYVPTEPILKTFNILPWKDQITFFNCLVIHAKTHNYASTLMSSYCLVQICMILIQGEEQVPSLHLSVLQTPMVTNQLKYYPF